MTKDELETLKNDVGFAGLCKMKCIAPGWTAGLCPWGKFVYLVNDAKGLFYKIEAWNHSATLFYMLGIRYTDEIKAELYTPEEVRFAEKVHARLCG